MVDKPFRRRPRGRGLLFFVLLSWLSVAPLFIASALLAQPAWAAGGQLSLHDAVQAATDRALLPAAADATAQAARERAVAAARWPDPVLRLALENVPLTGPDRYSTTRDFMTSRSVSVMQTFTAADKRAARVRSHERDAEAALSEMSVRRAVVQRETAIAWFELRAALERQTVLRGLRDEVQRQPLAAEAALRGGRATPTDLIDARDALARIEQAMTALDAEVANARRVLERWTGQLGERPLAAAPSLLQSSLDARDVSVWLARHPELLSLAAAEAQAWARVEVARAERDPDLTVELMLGQRGSRYPDMVSVGVSLPLPWDRSQRQDRELAARLAQADAARSEREEGVREYVMRTESWIEDWQSALARLAVLDRDRAPLAQQRVDVALASYRGGQLALSAVLAARRAALELRLERIDIELQAARAWARLEFLIPPDRPDAATAITPEGVAR